MITRVIESKIWLNKNTGRRVSIYGACPWVNESDKTQWELVSQGFTWECDNGTIGLGRKPVATRSEAEAIMQDWNKKGLKGYGEY